MSWHDADFSVSFFIFYKIAPLLQNFQFYKYLAQEYFHFFKYLLTKQKEKGKILKNGICRSAILQTTPFLLRFPALFRTEPPFV